MEGCNGKLLVYASSQSVREKRLQHVSFAAMKIARLLKLTMEIITFTDEFNMIYVYYRKGDSEEAIPIYCDNGRQFDRQAIYRALRNMIFVLSFHPRHSALRLIQKEVMLFS